MLKLSQREDQHTMRSVSGPLIILDILRCVTPNMRPAANGEWSMLLGE